MTLGLLGTFRFWAGTAKAQSKPVTQGIARKEYESLIYSTKGPDLFRAHCAACHGSNGKGGGPAAAALRTRPPDLTILTKKNGGTFPGERVQRIILSEEPSPISHGSREMPIWGPVFPETEDDQDFGNVRLHNLMKYLESIQQP